MLLFSFSTCYYNIYCKWKNTSSGPKPEKVQNQSVMQLNHISCPLVEGCSHGYESPNFYADLSQTKKVNVGLFVGHQLTPLHAD